MQSIDSMKPLQNFSQSQNNFKICMETQRTLNSQNNLEKEMLRELHPP